MQQLFVSDLDGTLLGPDGKLSDYSRRALTEMLEAGLQFTIATARAWGEIVPVLGDLPLTLPVIAINGAFLTDYRTGRHLVINNLPPQTAASIYRRILDHDLLPFVVGFDGAEDRLYWERLINEQMQWYYNILKLEDKKRLTHVDHLTAVLEQKVIAFAVMGPKENISELSLRLAGEYPGQLENFLFENFYTPGHWWLTIHDQRACKSKGIRRLLEMTGHSCDDLTVFGDHINDIKMFRLAKTAVAVANAEEAVKSAAHVVIGSNEQDSVVNYIRRQFFES
ncbi:MAG: Cof-type HAD-IIB family hydrolase [Planctomycetaceae bacterium]|nr:Cof-type HAD-IIB family hydrolase [Planctomycetaceae bacterium]